MGRNYDVRWHAASESWRSDCGELYVDKKGRQRRKTMAMRYPDGRKVPRSDKPAALSALARRLEEIRPAEASGYTVRQIAEFFLQRLDQRVQADQAAEKTYREYSKVLSTVVGILGRDTPADQVRAQDLQAIVESMREAGRSPATINALIGATSSCFSWAARPIARRGKDIRGDELPDRLIPANPFVKFPREVLPQAKVKYADRAEIARFLRWLWNRIHPERIEGPFTVGESTGLRHGPPRKHRPRDYWTRQFVLMIRLILWTGCRPSEACRARWEWIDWEAGVIVIPPNRWKAGRKTGKNRRLYLTPTLLRALRRFQGYPVRHPEHIFAHRHGRDGLKGGSTMTGKPWSPEALTNRMRMRREEAIAAGVDLKGYGDNRFHLYRLRHTRASDGLMGGISEATVAEVLGTSANQIRKTYGHLLDDHTSKAAMRMVRSPKS